MNRVLSSLFCLSVLASTSTARAHFIDENDTSKLCDFVVSTFSRCAEDEDQYFERRHRLCVKAASTSEKCDIALVNLSSCIESRPCTEINYQTEDNVCRGLIEAFIEHCEDAVGNDEDALFLKDVES